MRLTPRTGGAAPAPPVAPAEEPHGLEVLEIWKQECLQQARHILRLEKELAHARKEVDRPPVSRGAGDERLQVFVVELQREVTCMRERLRASEERAERSRRAHEEGLGVLRDLEASRLYLLRQLEDERTRFQEVMAEERQAHEEEAHRLALLRSGLRREAAELAAYNSALRDSEEDSERALVEIKEHLGRELEDARSAIEALQHQLDDLLQAGRSQGDQQEWELKKRQSELFSARRLQLASQEKAEQLQQRCACLQADLSAAKYSRKGLQQQHTDLQQARQAEAEQHRQQLSGLQAELSAARGDSDRLKQQVIELEEARKTEAKRHQQHLADTKAELSAARGNGDCLKQQLSQLEEVRKAEADQLVHLQAELPAAQDDGTCLRQQNTELEQGWQGNGGYVIRPVSGCISMRACSAAFLGA